MGNGGGPYRTKQCFMKDRCRILLITQEFLHAFCEQVLFMKFCLIALVSMKCKIGC
jgi:hypothetical protein